MTHMEPTNSLRQFQENSPSIPPMRLVRVLAEAVSDRHGVPVEDFLVGTKRNKRIVRARHDHVAEVHLARPHWSLPYIGHLLNRDHTTVLNSLRAAGIWKPRLTYEARRAWRLELAKRNDPLWMFRDDIRHKRFVPGVNLSLTSSEL